MDQERRGQVDDGVYCSLRALLMRRKPTYGRWQETSTTPLSFLKCVMERDHQSREMLKADQQGADSATKRSDVDMTLKEEG